MNVLNQEQLELAAREYCKIKDLNPDERVAVTTTSASGATQLLARWAPRWKVVAERLVEHALMNHCIDHAWNSTFAKMDTLTERYKGTCQD